MFFFLCGLLAVIAALVVTLPLFRSRSDAGQAVQAAHDIEVYRDQIAELDRDKANGLISQAEADYARAEIGRRLIKASAEVEAKARPGGVLGPAPVARRVPAFFAILILLVVPVTGFVLYGRIGMPGEPDRPLAARLATPDSTDINILIAKVEARLADNPDDVAGWEVLAPVYLQVGRPEDSAKAWRNVVRISGPSPFRVGNIGQALVVAAKGEVSAEAAQIFETVLMLDAKDARARFYLASRLAQTGKLDEALASYQALAAEAKEGADWLPMVNEQIAAVKARMEGGEAAPPGNPDAADIAAAEGMNDDDRQAMIATMVAGLDARLRADPNNFEGWMRLVRSYMVMGGPDKAADALARALKTFPATSAQGRELIEAARSLGVPMEGLNP